MRIFSVSDMHVDYDENANWVAQLSNNDYVDDVLIIAGDLSDKLSLVERCFEHCMKKFRHVFLYLAIMISGWINEKISLR